MLRILPLASAFHAPDAVRATVETLSEALTARKLAHRMVEDAGAPPQALLLVTGGTEHRALEALEGRTGPALLLAHPQQNALPAALEVLARLRQQGRTGRIVLLNAAEEGYAELARLAGHLELHARLGATRLGRIGAPSDWLVASMPGPATVKAAWGPEVVDVDLAELEAAIDQADPAEAAADLAHFRDGSRAILEPSAGDLEAAARVSAALRRLVAHHRLDACTLRCFDLVKGRGTTGCLGLSRLLDAGIPAACEGDLPSALGLLLAQALTGEPAFMANPQDLDPAEGTLWLAHCTVPRRLLSDYALRSHFESGLGVALEGSLPPGPVTLLRLGGADLRSLFVAEGELLACGHAPTRCRTQVQVRLDGGGAVLRELLTRPLGNHHVLIRGRWAEAIGEYHATFVAEG